MKRILFPATARPHLARQQILLDELQESFEVSVWGPTIENEGDLATFSIVSAVEFNNFLAQMDFDAVIIRADRFELLQLAGLCAYRGIPIIHIEGGAESGQGVIDSKVRHAITQLADYHFVTDDQARRKVIFLGADPDRVFNVGSLDVSFAAMVEPAQIIDDDYVLLLHHALPGEDTETVSSALRGLGYRVVGIKSNQDYSESLMHEEYSPEDFVSLMYHSKCLVGNSSAACKEASILGTPVVLTGRRQDGRIAGHNALRVPHEAHEITEAAKYQIAHGRYRPDDVYYRKDTEQNIHNILREIL